MQELSFRKDILPLKDKLFRIALRITLNSAEAEDIVQETLVRVWSKRGEWAQLESAEAYCLTIARNLALDRAARKEAQAAELPPDVEQTADTTDPHDLLVHKERLQLIHRFVSQLPEKQRTVMQLRDIEGKSYKEIAQLLSLTEDQVKVNLFRARQKVRQQFLDTERYGL